MYSVTVPISSVQHVPSNSYADYDAHNVVSNANIKKMELRKQEDKIFEQHKIVTILDLGSVGNVT